MTLDDLFDKFEVLYGQPKSRDPVEYVMTYSKELSGFSDAVIARAYSQIVSEHKHPQFWPTIALCKHHLKIAGQQLQTEKRMTEPPRGPTMPPLHQLHRLVHGPIADRAVTGGWLGLLSDHCHLHNRLPTAEEEHAMVRAAAEWADEVGRSGGSMSGALARAEGLLRRRRQDLERQHHERRAS